MTMRLLKPAALVLLTAALFWWFPSIEAPAQAHSATGPAASWASR